MDKITVLKLICGVIQILSLFFIIGIDHTNPVVLSLAGCAAVVMYFISRESSPALRGLFSFAGCCGLLLIVFAFYYAN
jgi:hypothetical protein